MRLPGGETRAPFPRGRTQALALGSRRLLLSTSFLIRSLGSSFSRPYLCAEARQRGRGDLAFSFRSHLDSLSLSALISPAVCVRTRRLWRRASARYKALMPSKPQEFAVCAREHCGCPFFGTEAARAVHPPAAPEWSIRRRHQRHARAQPASRALTPTTACPRLCLYRQDASATCE